MSGKFLDKKFKYSVFSVQMLINKVFQITYIKKLKKGGKIHCKKMVGAAQLILLEILSSSARF
jgi:hypothetical protein